MPFSATASADSANEAVFETHLPLPDRRQGKVRDIYRIPDQAGGIGRVLIVATDRISAFDVVMPTPIPGKGRLLTAVSLRWFDFLRPLGLVDDHLVSADVAAVPGLAEVDRRMLAGRIMVCRPARVVPIECVARGFLAGSGWNEYRTTGRVCGVPLPAGLRQCDRLPEPIFTPATKADEGHDENIDFDTAASIVGADLMARLRDLTLRLYGAAAAHAQACGIVLADTKFEFGFELGPDGAPTDRLLLIDEVLTPDSSRFWPAEQYRPGQDQPSFDKQFVRNYLLELVAEGRWHKSPPGPALPHDIVRNTMGRYQEAFDRLWGRPSGGATSP
ncbi:MAG: phosphoribosylaminoimidazolesuccinocarboxamide synthase [Phycisphaerales bacterium]|nr:phosphoribosylaminoimidazolesuccinocarboxamide synthase [Phycisphaerales bacterium]